MKRGYLMVQLAGEGKLRDLDRVVSECPKQDLLFWFTVGMFREACLKNRVPVMRYMLDRGLNVHFDGLAALHWVVTGADEADEGTSICPSLEYLVKEAGVPVSGQVWNGQCWGRGDAPVSNPIPFRLPASFLPSRSLPP
ncbi:unnamed protein product [Choristocarpus tenellus]